MMARRTIASLAVVTALCAPVAARAQTGAEAGAAAGQAADWAKRQKESGNASGVTPRVVSGRSPVQRGTPAPARIARKPSGAPAAISGQVLERGTGKPVPGVILRLVSTEPQYVIETKLFRTDSLGRWSFADVEPGEWSLTVDKDRLPSTYACSDPSRTVKVAKRDALALSPFTLYRIACVEGHVEWTDGYVFSDAPVLVAPRNPALPPVEGRVNGVGDYQICSAPADSAMVWIVLRDGRRLGRPVSLGVGRSARADFRPDPVESMPGTTLLLTLKTASGEKVPFGRVLLVGRRLGVAGEPWVVFQRDATANRDGEVLGQVPYGTYEMLGWNPRQGQWGREEQFVIARGAGDLLQHEITLRGASTPEEQAGWRQALLDRASEFQRRWVP